MPKVTTVFMDKKNSNDLYPPTLKSACIFIFIVGLSSFVYFKLNKKTNQLLTEKVSIIGYANVQGLVERTFHGKVGKFLGVPYAKPPIGHLRFKKPQPLEPVANWTNKTLTMVKYGASCYTFRNPQRRNKTLLTAGFKIEQSEDCLFLNIFVPVSKDGKLPGKPLPVMVWIHGGAFVFGSAAYYDPSELVTSQSVIVVTIQYRLSILGFAQTTNPNEAPGNMGLYDQSLALKWIKTNIGAFNGDTESITIFGESAGSISVGFHLISKQSVGLFNRAIMQSGAPLTMMHVGTESGPLWMEKVAIELRCPIKSRKLSKARYAMFKDDTYKCLRSVPVEKLLEVETKLIVSKKCTGFLPSVDHDTGFFGNHPFELLKSETDPFIPNVTEILIGHNGGEGTFLLSHLLPELFPISNDLPSNMSYEVIRETIKAKVPDMKEQIDVVFKAIINDMDPEKGNNKTQITTKFTNYLGDAGFYCPNLHFIDAFLKNDKRKVYYYLFNSRPEKALKSHYIWSKKAVHGEEIQFVFGSPFTKKSWTKFTPQERRLSLIVMKDWTNFAKSGSPRVNQDQWKPCQEEDERNHLVYENNDSILKYGMPESKCSNFFETSYEEIVNRYKYMGNL